MKRFVFLSFLSLMLMLAGCAKTSDSSGTTYSYKGAGSVYGMTLNADGTFSLTHAATPTAAVDLTVDGTYSRLSTGFVLLTVTSATGTGAPAAGATAAGLEVPGFVFFLKPMGSASEVIPMVTAGTCPSGDFNANWVSMDKESDDVSNSSIDVAGTFSFTSGTGASVLPAIYNVNGTATGASVPVSVGSGTCSSGIMSLSGGATMFLTSAGGAIVETNGSQVIMAMPQNSIAATDMAGDYAALVFADSTGSAQLFPASLTIPTAGTSGTGTQLSDISTGATTGGSVTFAFSAVNNPSTGFFKGTVTSGSTTPVIGMMTKNAASSGKNVIVIAGQNPGSTTRLFSLIAVQK